MTRASEAVAKAMRTVFPEAMQEDEVHDRRSTPIARQTLRVVESLTKASDAVAKAMPRAKANAKATAKAAPIPTGPWREHAISPYYDCKKPPQWTTVYVKYPKGTPGSRHWKQFNWIDEVSVFSDLKRAVANTLQTDWGYRGSAETVAFTHEIDGRQLPIAENFDAHKAAEALEKGEEIYLYLASPAFHWSPIAKKKKKTVEWT